MSNDPLHFMVTGATGYIASVIVEQLLKAGHTVHGSVRNLDNKDKYAHLRKAEREGPGKLHLFEADLLDQGAFDEQAQEVDFVLHTASPFKVNVKNAQKELVDPAVQGTKNVVAAALASDRVRRIVLTSSAAAIYGDNIDIHKTENGVFKETDWNQTSSVNHNAYQYSKTAAEKTAWELVHQQDEKDMVVINPGFVLGPSLANRKDSTSVDFVLQMLSGQFKTGAPKLYFGFVDVRDVAEMHIQAALTANAEGRYLAVSESGNVKMLADYIETEFPEKYPLPKRNLPTFLMYIFGPFLGFGWKFVSKNVGIPIAFDNSKAKRDLLPKFRPIQKSLRDQVLQIEDQGWVKTK